MHDLQQTEQAFLRALGDEPGSPFHRLAYADWLDEHGDPRAEFLRLEVELYDPLTSPVREAAIKARMRALKETIATDWIANVERAPIEKCESAFRFVCPERWENLRVEGDNPNERFCDQCRQTVYFCEHLTTAKLLAEIGGCVAVEMSNDRSEGDLESREFLVGLLA